MIFFTKPRLCIQRSTASSLCAAVRPPSSTPRRTQIAVVGSGPCGCYVAQQLTKNRDDIHVDVFERLPVPFGLCRYGVAPDHPEVKNVERQFLNMFTSGRVTWIGNVEVGRQLPIKVLLENYAAVVLATGVDRGKKLDIPGSELGGVISAADFVKYYNTYPFPHGSPHFCPFSLGMTREVVVIGNGNVAIDCVRVLAASYKYFCPTDMNCAAVKEFMQNQIRRIQVVARRGHAHSAFTTAEFRELTRYQPETVRVVVEPFDLQEALRVPVENPRARRRLLELLARHVGNVDTVDGDVDCVRNDTASAPCKGIGPTQMWASPMRGTCLVNLRYNLRPVRFLPHPNRPRYVGAVEFERSNTSVVSSRKETVTIPCDVVLTSVGYCSDSIPGVEFDMCRGAISHVGGRVKGMPRLYCAGWAKNGPKGVILQALLDAQETAGTILEDMASNVIPADKAGTASVCGGNSSDANDDINSDGGFCGKYGLIDFFVQKRIEPVSMAGLQRILHVESERGVDLGKRLEKINDVRAMLDVALGGAVGKKANNSIRGIMNERPDALLYLNELLDDTTDLAPLAKQLAREVPPIMASHHPPGTLHPSQL
ncbi:Pyridine nucleotide disulfide oxidoreductase NAD(P) binding Rossmann like domain [Trypanosoma vivax]|uniref:Putative adrenodoxin reductase n=1 Tax=Trypanosoma vivax (strain Y486) TaxID=1055687 RepID=G0U5M1_TRYVY|nr:Pyridine nucleotide disulfide oxidoreductase NAD(P) binding Rossmann like domain [Trypanosoma vivax]CCC51172.1 putative adrenodoxin reductase [Trypanosoma vivax Y486]